MRITWGWVVRVDLAKVPTEDLLAELQRRLRSAPLFSQPIPPPLYRESLKEA